MELASLIRRTASGIIDEQTSSQTELDNFVELALRALFAIDRWSAAVFSRD